MSGNLQTQTTNIESPVHHKIGWDPTNNKSGNHEARAEETYGALVKWFEATERSVRFSHDSISSCFRDGDHRFERTEKLIGPRV